MVNWRESFKLLSWFQKPKQQEQIGAVIYKTTAGQLYLLLEKKRQRWQLPSIAIVPDMDPVMAQDLLLADLRTSYKLSQLKVWQHLGRFNLADGQLTVTLQLLLVQLVNVSPSAADLQGTPGRWLKVDEALAKLSNDSARQAINLAVSKIRRARV